MGRHRPQLAASAILWGGAAAPASLLDALAHVGARLGTSYSLTESTGSVTYTDRGDPARRPDAGASAASTPTTRFASRSTDGSTAPAGQAGEILIRGDFITRGYFGDPHGTSAAIDADGWLHTGDLGARGGR